MTGVQTCALPIWRDSLISAFGGGNLYYAAKSFICVEVAKWLMELKVNLDVCTGGELAVALAAKFPADRIEFHGNNKSAYKKEQEKPQPQIKDGGAYSWF